LGLYALASARKIKGNNKLILQPDKED